MSQTEIIVLEPAGKQKKYTLKPHGNLDKVQKRWKSHLKNIGASWSDKKKIWTLSRDKLRDFEKIQSIISKEEDKNEDNKADDEDEDNQKDNKDKKDKHKKKRRKESSHDSSDEEDDDSEGGDDESESSDDDQEIIEFLKDKIKNLSTSTHNKTIDEDVDNSEDEDVIRLSRRLRYIMTKLKNLDKRVSDLEEENAFLHKQMASLKN